MKIKSFSIATISHKVRKLSEEERRKVKENIAQQLSSGAITLGEGVRLMRLAVGMTQAQYAEMTGVDIRVLAAVEKENANPTLETLQKLGRPYGFVVSFVKPQPAANVRPLTVDEWLGTDGTSEKLRKIASLLEELAESSDTEVLKVPHHGRGNLSSGTTGRREK